MKEKWGRFRAYLQANPLTAWVVGVAVCTVVFGLMLFFVERNPRTVYMAAAWAFAMPTGVLISRLFIRNTTDDPIPARQIEKFGELSIVAAAVSMTALGVTHFHNKLGLHLPDAVGFGFLQVFSWALMLAILLGVVARKTRAGRVGLTLTLGWLGLFLLLGFIALLRG